MTGRPDDQRDSLLSRAAPFRSPARRGHAGPGRAGPGRRRVRLWSAACSNGQEPYSIATTVLSVLPEAADLDVRILATDIDPNMVAEGAAGVYSEEALEAMPAPLRHRYFEKAAAQGRDRLSAGPLLRRLVSFRELNLIGDWPMRGQFDVIFCRNVVIYFDDATQERVWSRFLPLMEPGGYALHWPFRAGQRPGRRPAADQRPDRLPAGAGMTPAQGCASSIVDDSATMRGLIAPACAAIPRSWSSARPDRSAGSARQKIKTPQPRRGDARHRDAQHERAAIPRQADAPASAAGGDGLDAHHQGRERDAARAGTGGGRFRRQAQLDLSGGLEAFGENLRQKVRAAAQSDVRSRAMRTPPPRVPVRTAAAPAGSLIAIGASTGGVEALLAPVGHPAELPPTVVTQHMPPPSPALRRAAGRGHRTHRARGARRGAAGARHVYIAPGGEPIWRWWARRLAAGWSAETVNGHRPSVDVLFHSVAALVAR